MSSRPPWLHTITRGTPATGCLRPFVTSTSRNLPCFSVTSAMLVMRTPEPGRNAIAQGESKVVTSEMANGRPELLTCWAVEEDELPQLARCRKRNDWMKRAVILDCFVCIQ